MVGSSDKNSPPRPPDQSRISIWANWGSKSPNFLIPPDFSMLEGWIGASVMDLAPSANLMPYVRPRPLKETWWVFWGFSGRTITDTLSDHPRHYYRRFFDLPTDGTAIFPCLIHSWAIGPYISCVMGPSVSGVMG